MKKFFPKLVPFIFATILLFGFFSIHIAFAEAAQTSTPTCDVNHIGTCFSDAFLNLIHTILSIFVLILGVFIAIIGNILDFTVQYTIYGGGFSAFTASIKYVWALLRDSLNVCFIFILLYYAIRQIIGLSGKSAKDILVNIILAAIFINFSLFITQLVIDAGNIVATALYNQIVISTEKPIPDAISNITKSAIGTTAGLSTNIDLSGRLIEILNPEKVLDSADKATNPSGGQDMGSTVRYDLIKLIIFIITIYVFAFLTILLIGRFVMLVFSMITSPIGFLFDSIPGLETSGDWWKHLIDQTMVAPVMMFFLLLIIKLGQSVKGSGMDFFNYFLIIMLLFKTIEITKKFSGVIGETATKLATMATGAAVGLTAAAPAFVARQTLGRGSQALIKSGAGQSLRDSAASGNVLAKAALWTANKGATGTYDVRNTGIAKETFSQIKNIGGIDVIGKNAKASGVYGKNQTGFAGGQKKVTEDEIKKAGVMDQASKEYRDQQESDLNKKIEKAQKEGNTEELKTLSAQKTAMGENTAGAAKASLVNQKIEEKVAEKHPDFGGADAKLKKYQEDEAKILDNLKPGQMDDATKKQLDDIGVEKKKQQDIIDAATAYKKNMESAVGKAQVELEVMKDKSNAAVIKAVGTKEIRNKIATNWRNKIISMQTPSEREAIAKAVEKIPKEKTDEQKNADATAEKLDKLQDELKSMNAKDK